MPKVKNVNSEAKVVDDLHLSSDSEGANDESFYESSQSSTEQDLANVLKWLEEQGSTVMDPSSNIVQSVMTMIGDEKVKMTTNEKGKLQMAFLADRKACKSEASDTTSSSSTKSPPKINVSPPKFDLARYPRILAMKKLAPANIANAHHHFITERAKLAEGTRISQKLGAFNPFPPCDPDKVMIMAGWPGWTSQEMEKPKADWAEESSELLYQAMVFKNRLNLSNLTTQRELLNEPRFYRLKAAIHDLGL